MDWVEVMADHEHVEMLLHRVDREGPVSGSWEDGKTWFLAADPDDVRRVPAARAFGVEGMDRAALHGLDGVLDESAFVERGRCGS